MSNECISPDFAGSNLLNGLAGKFLLAKDPLFGICTIQDCIYRHGQAAEEQRARLVPRHEFASNRRVQWLQLLNSVVRIAVVVGGSLPGQEQPAAGA